MNTTNLLKKDNYNTTFNKMDIYKKDIKFLDEAITMANNSTMRMKHGSVVTKNGKIIGTGFNHERNQFKCHNHTDCSCHAEIDALLNAFGTELYSLLSTRKKSCVLRSKVQQI
jgi:deoxycytidylate deaminase